MRCYQCGSELDGSGECPQGCTESDDYYADGDAWEDDFSDSESWEGVAANDFGEYNPDEDD